MEKKTSEDSLFFTGLNASELPAISTHYQKKFGITLYINGKCSRAAEWKELDNSAEKELAQLDTNSDRVKEIIKNQARQKKSQLIAQEIEDIQASLPEDTYVGYVFTNGETLGRFHFEVAILSKNSIIKPISWGLLQSSIEDYLSKNSNPYLSHYKSSSTIDFIKAQANTYSCGPLGILYLKELLKNNAKLLRDDSSLSFFSGEGNYFFPPPQPLRYSQSSFYNKCLFAMLEEGDANGEVEFSHNCNITKVKTLKSLLEKNGEQNKALLENLESFKIKWKEAYFQAEEKRERMQSKTTKKNEYLDYRTYTVKKGTRVFFLTEEEANDLKIEEWNQGYYYLLIDTPEAPCPIYYVDSKGLRQPITHIDTEVLKASFDSEHKLNFFDNQRMQELGLTQHLNSITLGIEIPTVISVIKNVYINNNNFNSSSSSGSESTGNSDDEFGYNSNEESDADVGNDINAQQANQVPVQKVSTNRFFQLHSKVDNYRPVINSQLTLQELHTVVLNGISMYIKFHKLGINIDKSTVNRNIESGYFTRFRHWNAEDNATKLREIINAPDIQTVAQVIHHLHEYFINEKTQYDNHSLACYLLEALNQHLNEKQIPHDILIETLSKEYWLEFVRFLPFNREALEDNWFQTNL